MSEQPDEDQTTTDQSTDGEPAEPGEVADAHLPEDLQPGEDNPLATHPDQTGNADDQIGADREEDPETAPLSREEADYGSGGGGDGAGDGRVGAEEDDGSDTLDNGGGGAG